MNDKQHVFDLFNKANHHLVPAINRRTFCRFTGLAFISFFLPGCSDNEKNINLQAISQESAFHQFFDVLFPAFDLGLNKYKQTAMSLVQHLTNDRAQVVIQIYQRFKRRLWVKRNLGTKDYDRTMGEACLIDLLNSKHAEQCNLAMDIIYYEISKDDGLLTALWGRRFSLNDKKCVYWDNYDQAVS